ncbi:MAG: DsbC family protein [Gammaproteobacteria bacterium]|nr:DsbC family protein [Gammaproteobacteria bacterium]
MLSLALALASAAALAADAPPKLAERIDRLAVGAPPDAVTESPVPGLWEVRFGAHVFYFTADGGYMMRGELVDLETGRNLTEATIAAVRAAAIDRAGEDQMIIFGPEGEPKHTVSVFTDVDCPYCRRLHREIDQYTARGIEVRYLLYPRAGPDSETFRKAVSVWCAEGRRAALTRAKQGEAIPERDCENPVTDIFRLGQRLGVSGTPFIVTEDGRGVPGYVPAQRLLEILEDTAGS